MGYDLPGLRVTSPPMKPLLLLALLISSCAKKEEWPAATACRAVGAIDLAGPHEERLAAANFMERCVHRLARDGESDAGLTCKCFTAGDRRP